MKKFLVLFALAAFFSVANAQETKSVQIQVPTVISTSFSTSYPSVESPVWKKTGNNYVVYYRMSNNDAYVLYDPAEQFLFYHRLPYDVQAAQDKIRRAGLPSLLADRLAVGR
jgi:hypothetical protein